MKRLGLLTCFIITLAVACMLELTRAWMLLIVAGVVGGFLSKNFVKAIVAGGLGLLICWLAYLGAYYALNPVGVSIAISMFSSLLAISLTLVFVLGVLSASLGYFTSQVLEKRKKK